MMDSEDYDKIRAAGQRAAEAIRGCSVGISPFLDEWGTSVFISELKAAGQVSWFDSGGLPGASHRVVAYTCGKIPGVDEVPFVYLFIKPISGLTRPPVPEVLDALDKAGFNKDADVGDLYGEENGHFVVALDRKGIFPLSVSEMEVEGYVISRIEKSAVDKLAARTSGKDTTVASQRLDAVVSITANISRSKAKKMIEAGLVMVDYVPVKKAEKPVEIGSTISVKGKKRARITSLDGPTKRGRYRIGFEGIL